MKEKQVAPSEARISPVAWQHTNFYGRYDFTTASEPINMEEIVEAFVHHPILSIADEEDTSLKPNAPFRGVMQKTPTIDGTAWRSHAKGLYSSDRACPCHAPHNTIHDYKHSNYHPDAYGVCAILLH